MRPLAAIGFICWVQTLCFAQSTFNVVYNYTVAQGWPDAGGGGGVSVLETDSGFLVLGHQVATGGLTRDFVFSFDSAGGHIESDLELNALSPSDQNFGYIDPVHKDANGVIAAISSFDFGSDTIRELELARITTSGDLLWQVSVADSCPCGARQLRYGSDGHVVMSGFFGTNGMLMIADTNGVVDTMVVYPDTYSALGVRALAQGGYVLSGFRIGTTDDNVWVMRVDSVGNTIWRRNVGGSYHAFRNVSAIQTQDGGIVATCSYMPLPGSWNSPQWNYFRKWDIDGNVLWTEQYNQAQGSTTYDLEELPDGSLVASGNETGYYGLLMKLEADGDLVWLRRYTYYQSNGAGHLPYDVEPTSDGGFVLTGWAQQGINDSLPNLQMVWLLKVDSMGCLVPGCGWDGMEEVALGLEDALNVYPNPAHGTATVTATLPTDLHVRGTLRLVLVDALGRTVREQSVGRSLSTTNLDLGGVAAGVHYLHLRDEARWLSGVRLLVE